MPRTVRFAEEDEHIVKSSHSDPPSPSDELHNLFATYLQASSSDSSSERTQTLSTPPTSPSQPSHSPESFSSTPPLTRRISPTTPYPTIHVALEAPQPAISFNVSIPLSLQNIDPVLLSQPATITSKPMEIFCEAFPWRIVIQPLDVQHHVGLHVYPSVITIRHVLERLHDTMQKTVTDQELQRARSKPGSHDAILAVHQTYLRRDPHGRERMKRLDFLVGKNRFAGLEMLDPELNRWRLYVGT